MKYGSRGWGSEIGMSLGVVLEDLVCIDPANVNQAYMDLVYVVGKAEQLQRVGCKGD